MDKERCDPESDPFKPPAIPTLVHCIHCDEEYESFRIEWRVKLCRDGMHQGFWVCPIEGCDGAGFLFDIFPVDPDWRDEDGEKIWCEGESDDLEE